MAANDQGRSERFFHQFVQRHDAADQARTLGFVHVHHAAGERQIHGFGFANRTRQTLCATSARNDANLDFGLTKLGVLSGDDEVAHHGQFTTAAQCKSTDRGNDRFADAANGFPVAGDEVLVVNLGKAELGHGGNVGTSGKGFFVAGDDDATDLVVAVKYFEGLPQLHHQFTMQRIQLLGAVQRDDAHLFGFGSHLNEFVGHQWLQGVCQMRSTIPKRRCGAGC